METRSRRGADVEQTSQPHDWQRAPAVRQQFVLLERAQTAGIDFDDFLDRGLRNGEYLVTDVRDNRVDDGKPQRQSDRAGGATSRFGRDLQSPPKFLHRSADDVHADATAADAIGFVTRRKP